jgi:serine protease
MARLSRLLSAVSLGIAATAAVAAVAVATEYAPVHRAPHHRAEAGDHARVIVKFRERASVLSSSSAGTAAAGSGPQQASVMGSRLGLALANGRALGARTQVMTGTGVSSAALAGALSADPDVEWAEIDQKRYVQAAPVNDPLYPDNVSTSTASNGPASGQWYLRAPGTDASGRAVVSSIDIEPAWAITQGATSIVISDIDTGITAHPDLTAGNSKMLQGYDFITDLGVANDGNGRDADPSDAGDWVTATENSTKNGTFFGCNDDGTGGAVSADSSWHGTQTASILGASTNNGQGMAGTAYKVPVIAARALGKCGGYDSDIIAAAQWSAGIAVSGLPANAHPARVINMSLGGTGGCTQAYVDALTALRDKHVVVVAAAGNDEGLPVGTPANCKPAASNADQTPVVIAVAALRHAGTKVGFSDIGPEVTIAAPGGNCVNTGATEACLYPIVTALNSGTTKPVTDGGIYSDGRDHVSLGTSFATPMVAGTVALMLSTNPSLTNAQVVNIIKSTARPFPTVSDTSPQPPVCAAPNANVKQDECICTTATCGAGMLDAGAAVTRAHALAISTSTAAAADYTWPTAAAKASATTVVAGQDVTVDGSGSLPGSSGAAVTYAWSIPDGDSAISLGSTTGSSVTVHGVSAGTGQVQLSVTDPTSGLISNTTVGVTVTAAPSSGGGAANPAWLLVLAVAGLLLRPRARA